MLTTGNSLVTKHLWRVMHAFHMGDYVRDILRARHINNSSVAKAMGVSTQNFAKYLTRARISDDVLERMTAQLQFDLFGMVKQQLRQLHGLDKKGATTASDPVAPYGDHGGIADNAVVLTISMSDYEPDVQLEIFRFLQRQPKRTAKRAS